VPLECHLRWVDLSEQYARSSSSPRLMASSCDMGDSVTLRVVGAGVGRTGTHSLKLALERLLDGPCHHMFEVIEHPEQVSTWHKAVNGDSPDWREFLAGYVATVDWPSAAFWQEISAVNAEAVVLLSMRASPGEWWRSADATIFEAVRRRMAQAAATGQSEMVVDMLSHRFSERWMDEASAKAAYRRHIQQVRSSVPRARLVEWRPGDGWEPICKALDLRVPDDPFPHVNTTAEFRSRLDPAATSD
jgi:hypothetical protein